MDVVLIGLGAVGGTHLRVIEQIPSLRLVAAIDVSPSTKFTFRGEPLPIYHSVHDAHIAHNSNVVVVATPTPTHATVCREVAK